MHVGILVPCLAGQGFAGQGFAGQGFAGPGFAGQGFAGQGFAGPGFAGAEGDVRRRATAARRGAPVRRQAAAVAVHMAVKAAASPASQLSMSAGLLEASSRWT
jgi:hypothetical protein